jgi:hypothetical protein
LLEITNILATDAFLGVQDLVTSTLLCPPHDEADELIVIAHLTTNQKAGHHVPPRNRIKIQEPFYPCSEDAKLDMDNMIKTRLAWNIRTTNQDSELIQQACLAAGYLGFIFPVDDLTQKLESSAASADEVNLRRHFVKFSVLRFDQLSWNIISKVRALDVTTKNHPQSKDTIAAGCVLYCQLDHIKQGFKNLKFRLLDVSIFLRSCF